VYIYIHTHICTHISICMYVYRLGRKKVPSSDVKKIWVSICTTTLSNYVADLFFVPRGQHFGSLLINVWIDCTQTLLTCCFLYSSDSPERTRVSPYCIDIRYMYTYIYAYICIPTYVYIHSFMYINICIHKCIWVCVYQYVYMYLRMIYIYLNVHIHMYMYAHAKVWNFATYI